MLGRYPYAVQYVNELTGYWTLYDYAPSFWYAVNLAASARSAGKIVRIIEL